MDFCKKAVKLILDTALTTADLVTDILFLTTLSASEDPWWFGISLVFIIAPILIYIGWISMQFCYEELTKTEFCYRLFCSPLFIFVEALAIQDVISSGEYGTHAGIFRGVKLIELFEAYPQLVLQTRITFDRTLGTYNITIFIISATISTLSLGFKVAEYIRCGDSQKGPYESVSAALHSARIVVGLIPGTLETMFAVAVFRKTPIDSQSEIITTLFWVLFAAEKLYKTTLGYLHHKGEHYRWDWFESIFAGILSLFHSDVALYLYAAFNGDGDMHDIIPWLYQDKEKWCGSVFFIVGVLGWIILDLARIGVFVCIALFGGYERENGIFALVYCFLGSEVLRTSGIIMRLCMKVVGKEVEEQDTTQQAVDKSIETHVANA